MLPVSRVTEKGSFLRVVVAGCVLVGMTGCKLVDQKTFNPNAGVAPKPYIPPPPPGPPPVPPLIELAAGTPASQWEAPVDQITRLALSRKPDVLFVVRCLVPLQANADAEQSSLMNLVQGDGRAVLQEMINAGASEAQVEMSAMPDSSVTKPVVRVYVR